MLSCRFYAFVDFLHRFCWENYFAMVFHFEFIFLFHFSLYLLFVLCALLVFHYYSNIFFSLFFFFGHRTLDTVQIPFEADNLAILICNSNVRHELSHSEYPTRRKQCANALELMGLKSYKDATMENVKGKFIAIKILLYRCKDILAFTARTECIEIIKCISYGLV